MTRTVARPLFEAFPILRDRLPFVPLADLPTPLERMERLSAQVDAEIWVKRDGLTHPVYGGNKIRKFEFVFGDVLRKRAQAVLTGGGLGSHHTLATAVIARQFGLQAVCSYYCQPIDGEVHRNLRLSAPLGIDAHFCGDYAGLAISFVWQHLRWFVRTGRLPYFIYPGASGALGVLGYVNAAYEIKAQLKAIGAAEPDALFVAVGSCGTFAGLVLGARMAGLRGRIVGVRVIEKDVANRRKIARLINRTARYLQQRAPSLAAVKIKPDQVQLLDGYMGPAYAHPTPAALQAVDLVTRAEGLRLETTYTGKAMAALLDHARQHPRARLVFVDTLAEAPTLNEGSYHHLPEEFWPVFDRAHEVHCRCLRAWRDPDFCWKPRTGRGAT
jgi:D-cysteine desulfhydrase